MEIEVETLTGNKVRLVSKDGKGKIFFDVKGNMYQIMNKNEEELFGINEVYYCIDKSNKKFEDKKFVCIN